VVVRGLGRAFVPGMHMGLGRGNESFFTGNFSGVFDDVSSALTVCPFDDGPGGLSVLRYYVETF